MDVSAPRPAPLTGSRSHARRRRRLGHLLAGLAGWAALALLWAWQLDGHVPADWLAGIELILLLVAGWVCFTVAWVAWSRSIYRRRHRRTTPLRREIGFAHDSLGRAVVAPGGIAEARGQVVISLSGDDVKRYEFAPRDVGEIAPAAGAPHAGRDVA